MSKHTPGPWKLGQIDGNFIDIDASNWGALAVAVWLMEEDQHDGKNSPVCEANARLIAAAPDLLEALERLVSERTAGLASAEAWSDARAAIAKSRGEQ